MTFCPCGNTARHGELHCGRCDRAARLEEDFRDTLQLIRGGVYSTDDRFDAVATALDIIWEQLK